MTDKLDIYSDLSIPFDVATWARGHKHNVTAWSITKCIKQRDEIRAKIRALEQQLDSAENDLQQHIADARVKMDECKGV